MSARGWPLLVAEVANSHGGDEDYLRELVGRLAAGSADAVKFQPISAGEICSVGHPMRGVFESLQIQATAWASVSAEVRAAGKEAWFDVYGPASLAVALESGADGLKIHAMDADDDGLLDAALSSGLPVTISCGGSTPDEIAAAVEVAAGRPLCLMLGFQRFPTPVAESHLARVPVLRERFGVPVGYQDHSPGDDPMALVLPCVAVSHGAVSVEKHVYLPGRETPYDFQSAVSPDALDALRGHLVSAKEATGAPDLALSAAEEAYRLEYRKPATAARALPAGHVLRSEDVVFVRAPVPQGQTPIHRAALPGALGRTLAREVPEGDALTEEALT